MSAPVHVEQLALAETTRLAELEHIVEKGLQTFIDVGRALAEIRDTRLYRVTDTTFEAYCLRRWSFGRSRAYRLIDAAHVVSPIGDIDPPGNEAQARELVPLRDDPQALRELWAGLRHEYGERVTADLIRGAVRRAVNNQKSTDQRQRMKEDFAHAQTKREDPAHWPGEVVAYRDPPDPEIDAAFKEEIEYSREELERCKRAAKAAETELRALQKDHHSYLRTLWHGRPELAIIPAPGTQSVLANGDRYATVTDPETGQPLVKYIGRGTPAREGWTACGNELVAPDELKEAAS